MAFPGTKFLIPHVRPGWLAREELVAGLVQDVLTRPLTVLRAPAGYGKTTLAAMAMAEIDRAGWVCVDADDNDHRRFLASLCAAVGSLASAAASALASATGPDGTRRAATALLNAVADGPGEVVVVLDEWEVITEPAVHAELEFLVERAPSNLHLVLTTRHDPPIRLARLRTRELLAERGPDQLRFSRDEAERLFAGLGLATGAVEEVHRRTDGWAAGLRLLAASMADRPDGLPLLPGEGHLFAFIADEVFDRQPVDVQRFLVETSVLSTVSGPAAGTVSGRSDAAELVVQLARRGLFLTEWQHDVYRYHQLFLEFLHRRLARWPSTERIALFRRAAAAESEPVASARHLVAAGDCVAAADVLESAGAELLHLGRAPSVRELLRELPEAELSRPGLLVLAGEVAYAAGDIAGARRAFERAGTVTARLAECLMLQGEAVAGHELVDRALDEPLDPATRVSLLITRARSAQISGQLDLAEQSLASAVAVAIAESELATAATHLHPTLALIPHGLDQLERFVDVAADRLEGPPELQVQAAAACVDMLRGRLAQGIDRAARTQAAYRRFGGAPPFLAYMLISMRLVALGPSTAALDPVIDELRACSATLTEASFMYPNLWFMIGRAFWLRGRFAQAREALARMSGCKDAPPGSARLIEVNRISLDGLVAIADGDLRRADLLLHKAVEASDAMGLVDIYGSARIRLAYLHILRGHPERACRVAEPALAQCERERQGGRILFEGRMAVPVLELVASTSPFAAGLVEQLGEFAAPLPVTVPGSSHVLTAREVEVLRLIVDGRTNREIARQLVLGEETIKTHVARVLRKLDATNRTAAAARARELGL